MPNSVSLRGARWLAAFFVSFAIAPMAGELAKPPSSFAPKVASASNEGEQAIRGMKAPEGFKLELFAAEPHLANPVAFSFDRQGRLYVVETFRLHAGVTDIRGHMNWLDEDLASRSVEDRLGMMKRQEGAKFQDYSLNSDRVKLVVDTDGDGKADDSTVFAEGFNAAEDGIAAGVLARGSQVWFANLPNVWLLEDNNGDGVADDRRSLSHGYGVRVGFLGHDLHGLVMGPDGKIYFSIGDRGSRVVVNGAVIGNADTGSVFRCNPDGSELEEFAFGLRNPQELAFDKFGNLFTGDNNSDGGDQARFVYLVDGGDSGWRVGWQFLERPNSRGPWNSEKMWHPHWEGQAAHLTPPLANIGAGPSGLTYYPGTGLSEKYQGHFFMADFRGTRGSGIHTFTVSPKGAWFEVAGRENFLWDILPTDVDFGIDGGIYYSDWVSGWGMTGKGRVYRAFEPSVVESDVVKSTKALLSGGFKEKSSDQLVELLSHADMRVRMEAQFELASRRDGAASTLAAVAKSNPSQLARIHAIWGLGQIDRSARRPDEGKASAATRPLIQLLKDSDPEIRAQAAKVLGERAVRRAAPTLIALLQDSSPRVAFFAAQALGRIGDREAVSGLLEMLRQNDNKDPYLRHAASLALARIGDVGVLASAAGDESVGVRIGALLALRRLERSEVALFLKDASPLVVAEAARAINDVPISGAIADLAAMASTFLSPQAKPAALEVVRRVANANLRLGTREAAHNLSHLAMAEAVPQAVRAEAVQMLEDFTTPDGKDRVTGLWRPAVGRRNQAWAVEALGPALSILIQSGKTDIATAAAHAAGALRPLGAAPTLEMAVRDAATSEKVRVEALRALALVDAARIPALIEAVANDPSEEVRKEALRLQSTFRPADVLPRLTAALQSGALGEKQSALAALGDLKEPGVGEVLAGKLDALLAGKLERGLTLELLEAAAKREEPAIAERLAKYKASYVQEDPVASNAFALEGGVAAEGRKVFFERAEASCLRCHKVAGEGGEAGPDLTQIGARQAREYLLESVVHPNAKIAQGFESYLISMKDGVAYAGIISKESETELLLNSPEDGFVTLKKADIESKVRGSSGMPEGLAAVMTPKDLRDLVEYLSSLK